MTEISFIQADSQHKIFMFIRRELFKKEPQEVEHILSLGPRNFAYYRSACYFFGLIEPDNTEFKFKLSKRGKNVFFESDEEKSKKIFYEELLNSKIVQDVFKNFKNFDQVKSAYFKDSPLLISIFNNFGYEKIKSAETKKRRVEGSFFPLLEYLYEIKFTNELFFKKTIDHQLQEIPPPKNKQKKKIKKRAKPTKIDYLSKYKQNKKTGDEGEKLVVEWERNFLKKAGKNELANKVERVSETYGDYLGYDILSFNLDGSEKYIEVKSTTNPSPNTPFHVSRNEHNVSLEKQHEYYIYRVYDLNNEPKFYVKKGPIENSFNLECESYIALIE